MDCFEEVNLENIFHSFEADYLHDMRNYAMVLRSPNNWAQREQATFNLAVKTVNYAFLLDEVAKKMPKCEKRHLVESLSEKMWRLWKDRDKVKGDGIAYLDDILLSATKIEEFLCERRPS